MFKSIISILLATILGLLAWIVVAAWHEGQTPVPPGQRLSGDQLLAQWATDYAAYDNGNTIPLHLGYIKGLSPRFTEALGNAEINFGTGAVAINISGLEPPPEGFVYEAWLVDHIPGPQNSVALDLGDGGDRIINLGTLPAGGVMAA